jgi:hypothetical protein
MTTKKNIPLLTIVAVLAAAIVLGVCGCPWMGKHTDQNTTPTPTPAGS